MVIIAIFYFSHIITLISNRNKFIILPSDPFLWLVSDFLFFPQPVMSQKSKGQKALSRDEYEVHQALSPASGRQGDTGSSHQSTGQPPNQPQTLSLGDLSSLIKDSVIAGVKEGIELDTFNNLASALEKIVSSNKQSDTNNNQSDTNNNNQSDTNKQAETTNPPPKVSNKRPRPPDEDDDLPRVGSDDVQEDTAPPGEVFGAHVNDEYEYANSDSGSDSNISTISEALNKIESRNPPQSHAKDSVKIAIDKTPVPGISSDINTPPMDEPDADLPSVDPRPPATWNPKQKIMKWVSGAVETEWSPDHRKKFVEKFHPFEKYDHLLNPVKMPKKLYKAIRSPYIKQKDYLFNRSNTEKDLYNASSDLCTSLRPFIEALDLLDDRQDCGHIKNLIGQGMMGIFSANKKISRARREIGRRCVRLDCADALYGVSPSHFSLFGGVSDSEAAKTAKETTKTDESIVFIPKPKKKIRPSYSSQGFQSQGFQQPPYYNNYNNQNTRRNQNQSQRGRGRRGRRGNQRKNSNSNSNSNSKASNSKE